MDAIIKITVKPKTETIIAAKQHQKVFGFLAHHEQL